MASDRIGKKSARLVAVPPFEIVDTTTDFLLKQPTVKENIRVLENKFELILLDYNFLTSPKKLMEYQSTFFENNLIQLNINKLIKLETLKDISLDDDLKN